MYPKEVTKFIQWSKAMVAGATVAKPHYPGTRMGRKGRAKPQRGQQRRRRRKKAQE